MIERHPQVLHVPLARLAAVVTATQRRFYLDESSNGPSPSRGNSGTSSTSKNIAARRIIPLNISGERADVLGDPTDMQQTGKTVGNLDEHSSGSDTVSLLNEGTPNKTQKKVGIWPLHLDPPTLEHIRIVEDLLDNRALGLEKIILLPSTHFSVSIQYSLHIAAMACLAMRDVKRVEVDLNALEKPATTLPRLQELIREVYGAENTVLIHWLPDVTLLKDYVGSESFLKEILTVLLRPMASMPESHFRLHLPPKRKVIPVTKVQGKEVRRFLYDAQTDVRTLIPECVFRYAQSHGLYQDIRTRRSKTNSVATGGSFTYKENALSHNVGVGGHVIFPGIIPRLEILYDERNVLAAEISKRLRPFSVPKGEHPDLIVPIGGDGYMMHCVRKFWRRFIPFFGVNAGHVGYLLNDARAVEEMISGPLMLYQTAMLHVSAWSYAVEDKDERDKIPKEQWKFVKQEDLAFNDAWIERHSGQTALLNVNVDNVQRLQCVRGDAILVATAAGSTAYAQALGASPLPISAPMLQLVGSNCVTPARWKPVHLNSDATIELTALSTTKRPCHAFCDGVDLGNVKKMVIRSSRVAGVQLAFAPSCDLQSKLYKLQFPAS